MENPKIHESEYRFCLIMWEHEPVSAAQLGWKRTTTYTVIKRLGDRGVLQNESGTVTSLISKKMLPTRSAKFERINRIAIGHVQSVLYIVSLTV